MKTYTEEEVITLLVEERERGMKICQEYMDDHLRIYWDKRAAGNEFVFVNKDIVETCRLMKLSISGLPGLSHAVGETIEKKITKNLKKIKLIAKADDEEQSNPIFTFLGVCFPSSNIRRNFLFKKAWNKRIKLL